MPEPINIVYYEEALDNWGRTESSRDPERLKEVLQTIEEFTDDMTFEDNTGHVYFIDELIGHQVKIGDDVFIVPAD
jgi:hypothetical protein